MTGKKWVADPGMSPAFYFKVREFKEVFVEVYQVAPEDWSGCPVKHNPNEK